MVIMEQIASLTIGQLAIAAIYCLGLARLSKIQSHVMVFAACFLLSIALAALVLDVPNGVKESGWNLAALASVGVVFALASLAMLLGSLASWRLVSRTSYAISAQMLIAAVCGLASFFLGAIAGFVLEVSIFGVHI